MNDIYKQELIKQHDFALSMATKHSERYHEYELEIDWANYQYWNGVREGIRIALDYMDYYKEEKTC